MFSFSSGIAFGAGFGMGIILLGLGIACIEDLLSSPPCRCSHKPISKPSEQTGEVDIELKNLQEMQIDLKEIEKEIIAKTSPTLAANNDEEEKVSS